MKYIFKIVLLAAFLMYSVYSLINDTNSKNDNSIIDDFDKEHFTNQEEMENLFGSEMFKFLENIDEDAMVEGGKEQYIGRANENTYCYIRDPEPYHYFSTKTHYPEVNGSAHMDPAPGCEVIYVWMVMRHGIRYGSGSKTEEYYQLGKLRDQIVKNAGEKQTEMCLDDIFNFLFWIPTLQNDKIIRPETLTENGYILMKKKGKLLKEKFPHLIPNIYNPEKIKIEFSDEIKVNQSVEAITEELFGKPFLPTWNPNGVLEQLYQSNCRRPQTIDKETGQNYTYLTQNSDYVIEMINEISLRLGFQVALTYREVSMMYDACQYEIAWGFDRSPWCAVFTKENLKVMEYISDISYYYFCGPGDIYNYFQGCVILKDLMEKLMDTANNEGEHGKLTLYLAHSTTILLLITQLGLIDEPKLTNKNYFQMADRKWRTSFLAPYTGNIMAILQRCSSGEKYRVKFLLNEKPFVFNDVCDTDNLCSLSKVYKMFESVIKSEECSTRYCNHTAEEMCKNLEFDSHECEILRYQLEQMDEKAQFNRAKSQESEDSKTESKEFIYLEKEYRIASILIVVSCLVIIGVFFKMSRIFSRIFRKPETTSTTQATNKKTPEDKIISNKTKEIISKNQKSIKIKKEE